MSRLKRKMRQSKIDQDALGIQVKKWLEEDPSVRIKFRPKNDECKTGGDSDDDDDDDESDDECDELEDDNYDDEEMVLEEEDLLFSEKEVIEEIGLDDLGKNLKFSMFGYQL